MKIKTLSIVVGTAACNAACPFCVSKMTGLKKLGYHELKVNWRNFAKTCRLAQIHQTDTVLFTGKGEPLLYPRQITKYLEQLESYQFPIIELQTNGIRLATQWEKFQSYLKTWYQLGLTTIAISIVHSDPVKNRQIYTPMADYPDLKSLTNRLHKLGFMTRFSLTMLQSYVDSVAEVKNIIDWTRSLQVAQLTLRPVAITTTASENRAVYEYTRQHLLEPKTLEQISAYLAQHGQLLRQLPHGADIYDVDGQNVALANALTLDKSEEYLRQIIFYPDGKLMYDWQHPGARLF